MERISDSRHWNEIYGKYRRDQLGWYADVLSTSLEWILEFASGPADPVLDMGGGSSTLVDELLVRSFSDVTVVDLSDRALEETRTRLASRGLQANLICGDARNPELALPPVRIWHDRAAFHFLRDPSEIHAYLRLVSGTLESGGHLILGVFSENAPPTCSGLPVQRHSLESLQATFGSGFILLSSQTDLHITPGGVEQEYLYTAWKKRSTRNQP